MIDYNDMYKNNEDVWGSTPEPVKRILEGNVRTHLDLGSGQGNIPMYLAEHHGRSVTAVEITEFGANQLEEKSRLMGKVRSVCADIVGYMSETTDTYDMVSAINVLHQIKPIDKAHDAIQLMKEKVTPGGTIALALPIPEESGNENRKTIGYDAFMSHFGDWEVVHNFLKSGEMRNGSKRNFLYFSAKKPEDANHIM